MLRSDRQMALLGADSRQYTPIHPNTPPIHPQYTPKSHANTPPIHPIRGRKWAGRTDARAYPNEPENRQKA